MPLKQSLAHDDGQTSLVAVFSRFNVARCFNINQLQPKGVTPPKRTSPPFWATNPIHPSLSTSFFSLLYILSRIFALVRMIQLLVLWLALRKLAQKHHPLDEKEQAAAAFLQKHVFSLRYILDGDDCRVCDSDKTWLGGIMLKIPPLFYMASGSFSYDFNVAFDVVFCKALVGAYLNDSSIFKGVLVMWSIMSTCFGFLFWFFRWKSPAYFIHQTTDEEGNDEFTHYSIDVGGIITSHEDKEDSVNGNVVSTCQHVTLLALDEASQIIISILSLTLLDPISNWPGFIEWLNIASSICGFLWYFYSLVSENRYWGVHVLAGPFWIQPQRVEPTSRTLNVIDGLFDSFDTDICHACTTNKVKHGRRRR